MNEPTSCDFCANNFLSHRITWCPDCGMDLCSRCELDHSCTDYRHDDDYPIMSDTPVKIEPVVIDDDVDIPF